MWNVTATIDGKKSVFKVEANGYCESRIVELLYEANPDWKDIELKKNKEENDCEKDHDNKPDSN